jgi:predicted HTH transcriptional regulator
LIVPATDKVPVEFNKERFIRIGSSKTTLRKYADRESELWNVLRHGIPTIINTESDIQDLTFEKLLTYYLIKGMTLNIDTYKRSLSLLTKDSKYNVLAKILSDNPEISVRVALFNGKTKADKLYSIREFGNVCILFALQSVLDYGDVLNVKQVDERNRVVERKEVALFDIDAYRESVINAFAHNDWLGGNAPMISVFSDRIEIVSHGGMPADQNHEDFFKGISRPVNDKLATILVQLRISEKIGRGVPKVVNVYGQEAYSITKNSITVTIPYNIIDAGGTDLGSSDSSKSKIKSKIIAEIRNNPNIKTEELMEKLNLSRTGVQNHLRELKNNNSIKRFGSNRDGFWAVME